MKDIKDKVRESWEEKFTILAKKYSKIGSKLMDNNSLFSSKEGRDLQVEYENLTKELEEWKKDFSELLDKVLD